MSEKDALISSIKRLMNSNTAPRARYSYKTPETNPIGYIVLAGIFCVSIVAIFLHKSNNDKCRCD